MKMKPRIKQKSIEEMLREFDQLFPRYNITDYDVIVSNRKGKRKIKRVII